MSSQNVDPGSCAFLTSDDASTLKSPNKGSLTRPLWVWPFVTGVAVALAAVFATMRFVEVSSIRAVEIQQDVFAGAGPRTACETDKWTLEVAVEAWYAMYGMGQNPTQGDLVDAGLLRETIDSFEIRPDGSEIEVVSAPASDCG